MQAHGELASLVQVAITKNWSATAFFTVSQLQVPLLSTGE